MNAYRAAPGDRPLTLEEFERLPEEQGYRVELVRGWVVREPWPGAEHGGVTVKLASELAAFVRERRLGRVLVDTGFVLSEGPGTVRAPDVACVAVARVPAGRLPVGWLRGAPELAVDVLSPSDTASQIREKVRDYLDAGARAVWVVDPRARAVTVHEPGGGARVLGAGDDLDGGGLLPGFRLRVGELFEG